MARVTRQSFRAFSFPRRRRATVYDNHHIYNFAVRQRRTACRMSGHIEFSPSEVSRVIPVLFPHLKKSGAELRGPCKLHGGKNDSFALNPNLGLWDCKSKCGRGGDLITYQMEITGQDFKAAKAALYDIVGREFHAVVPVAPGEFILRDGKRIPIEAAYSYQDAAGKVVYRVVRLAVQPGARKDFSQQRSNGTGGWIGGLAKTEPLPYRLPQLAKAQNAFVVEGERDADNLSRLGLVATCNSGGAGQFKAVLVPHFAGKNVVIIPDNDDTGRKHAESVAALLEPVAASVRVIHLPGLPEKGDVSDYLASGKGEADIRALVRATEPWTPRPTVEESMTVAQPSDGQAGPPKMRSVTEVESIRTYAAQKIDWLVDGLIAAGTVTLITGESGSGKSTVATAICSASERGVNFAGLATQRRPVLVLDRENPLSIVVDRFDRLGVNDSLNFKYWGGWAAEEAPAPFSPIVIAWVQACEPKPLIVVDSLVAFLEGDENSATEVRAYMNGFRRLADIGATVIILHHSGKAETSKEYRGSSDIKASIDVGYHLANLGDSSRLTMLRLRAFKARFSVQTEVVLHYADGGFRMDTRGPVLTVTEALRELLIQHPRIGVAEFGDAAVEKGIARAKARDFLANGIKAGTVGFESGPHNSRYHIWKGPENSPEQTPWEM